MKKQTSMLAILCAAAATAALGDDSWNVTTGGALDAANWTPSGIPGAADTATLRYAQSAPYTLDASMSVLAINVNANATLDLGAGKSFLAEGDSSNSKIQIAGNTTVQLLSGTFGIGDTGNRFFLGDTGTTRESSSPARTPSCAAPSPTHSLSARAKRTAACW